MKFEMLNSEPEIDLLHDFVRFITLKRQLKTNSSQLLTLLMGLRRNFQNLECQKSST